MPSLFLWEVFAVDNVTAYEVLKRYQGRINAYGALCQMNWETRSGGKAWASELFLAANNAAGIKAGTGWSGPVYNKVSWEQRVNGERYSQLSAFRKYSSFDEFAADYVKKIEASYPLCVNRADNFFGYFAGLLAGRYGAWATDTAYFRRMVESSVTLAPEVFGAAAAAPKLKAALLYAIESDYLSDAEAAVALEVLGIGDGNDGTESVPLTPEIKTDSAISTDNTGRKIICIDPGHGGKDPGACAGGVQEKDVALKVAQMIGSKLSGYKVIYTRSDDTYPTLSERAALANTAKADLFISVHCNSATSAQANGIEVFTHTSQSKGAVAAAKAVYRRLLPVSGMNGRGVKNANLQVLRDTAMPAVLVELGFLSNAGDRAKLTAADWQEKAAVAIAAGIEEVFA